MSLPSATAATSPASASFSTSRRREKRRCVSSAASKFPRKLSSPRSRWTRTKPACDEPEKRHRRAGPGDLGFVLFIRHRIDLALVGSSRSVVHRHHIDRLAVGAEREVGRRRRGHLDLAHEFALLVYDNDAPGAIKADIEVAVWPELES